MNKDFRVLTTFPRHPKTIKLKRILGTWEPIITLWAWAAENKPSGNLTGMEAEDIAIAAIWDGDPKQLIDALLKVKYLEKIDGAYVLHGWKEHNAYVAHAEKRSEKARLAAQARWDKRLNGCSDDAKECSEHDEKMPQVHAPTPTPNPNPNPSKKKKEKKKSACAWPENFCLTDEMRGYAVDKGIDPEKIDAFFEDFRDWALSKGATYKDWAAAFRTRVSKAPEYGKQYMIDNLKSKKSRQQIMENLRHKMRPANGH
jgi:hypothetical protein